MEPPQPESRKPGVLCRISDTDKISLRSGGQLTDNVLQYAIERMLSHRSLPEVEVFFCPEVETLKSGASSEVLTRIKSTTRQVFLVNNAGNYHWNLIVFSRGEIGFAVHVYDSFLSEHSQRTAQTVIDVVLPQTRNVWRLPPSQTIWEREKHPNAVSCGLCLLLRMRGLLKVSAAPDLTSGCFLLKEVEDLRAELRNSLNPQGFHGSGGDRSISPAGSTSSEPGDWEQFDALLWSTYQCRSRDVGGYPDCYFHCLRRWSQLPGPLPIISELRQWIADELERPPEQVLSAFLDEASRQQNLTLHTWEDYVRAMRSNAYAAESEYAATIRWLKKSHRIDVRIEVYSYSRKSKGITIQSHGDPNARYFIALSFFHNHYRLTDFEFDVGIPEAQASVQQQARIPFASAPIAQPLFAKEVNPGSDLPYVGDVAICVALYSHLVSMKSVTLGELKKIGDLAHSLSWNLNEPSRIRNYHGYRNRSKNNEINKATDSAKIHWEMLDKLRQLSDEWSALLADLRVDINEGITRLAAQLTTVFASPAVMQLLNDKWPAVRLKARELSANVPEDFVISSITPLHSTSLSGLENLAAFCGDRIIVNRVKGLLAELASAEQENRGNGTSDLYRYAVGYMVVQLGELCKSGSEQLRPEPGATRTLFNSLGKTFRQQIKQNPRIIYARESKKFVRLMEQLHLVRSPLLRILEDLGKYLELTSACVRHYAEWNFSDSSEKRSAFEQEHADDFASIEKVLVRLRSASHIMEEIHQVESAIRNMEKARDTAKQAPTDLSSFIQSDKRASQVAKTLPQFLERNPDYDAMSIGDFKTSLDQGANRLPKERRFCMSSQQFTHMLGLGAKFGFWTDATTLAEFCARFNYTERVRVTMFNSAKLQALVKRKEELEKAWQAASAREALLESKVAKRAKLTYWERVFRLCAELREVSDAMEELTVFSYREGLFPAAIRMCVGFVGEWMKKLLEWAKLSETPILGRLLPPESMLVEAFIFIRQVRHKKVMHDLGQLADLGDIFGAVEHCLPWYIDIQALQIYAASQLPTFDQFVNAMTSSSICHAFFRDKAFAAYSAVEQAAVQSCFAANSLSRRGCGPEALALLRPIIGKQKQLRESVQLFVASTFGMAALSSTPRTSLEEARDVLLLARPAAAPHFNIDLSTVLLLRAVLRQLTGDSASAREDTSTALAAYDAEGDRKRGRRVQILSHLADLQAKCGDRSAAVESFREILQMPLHGRWQFTIVHVLSALSSQLVHRCDLLLARWCRSVCKRVLATYKSKFVHALGEHVTLMERAINSRELEALMTEMVLLQDDELFEAAHSLLADSPQTQALEHLVIKIALLSEDYEKVLTWLKFPAAKNIEAIEKSAQMVTAMLVGLAVHVLLQLMIREGRDEQLIQFSLRRSPNSRAQGVKRLEASIQILLSKLDDALDASCRLHLDAHEVKEASVFLSRNLLFRAVPSFLNALAQYAGVLGADPGNGILRVVTAAGTESFFTALQLWYSEYTQHFAINFSMPFVGLIWSLQRLVDRDIADPSIRALNRAFYRVHHKVLGEPLTALPLESAKQWLSLLSAVPQHNPTYLERFSQQWQLHLRHGSLLWRAFSVAFPEQYFIESDFLPIPRRFGYLYSLKFLLGVATCAIRVPDSGSSAAELALLEWLFSDESLEHRILATIPETTTWHSELKLVSQFVGENSELQWRTLVPLNSKPEWAAVLPSTTERVRPESLIPLLLDQELAKYIFEMPP